MIAWRRHGLLLSLAAALAAAAPALAYAAPGNPAMSPPPGTPEEPEEPDAIKAVADPGLTGGPDLPATTLPGRLELHRPNYVLPLTWSEDAEGSEDSELKFQISLKHQVGNWPVYLAYTQTAYFRWLDEDDSRPFRETNYNPEIWYRLRPGRLSPDWLDWLGIDAGFEHESNGEEVPESRSWDRLYLRPWFEHGRWLGALKLWHRVEEDPKDSPDDPNGDDNPDILDYYGHHELKVGYTFDDGHWLELTTRYAFSDDRGAARLRYAWVTPTRNSYFFLEAFSGYGESLETFREKRTRVGIGFALLR